MNKKLFIFFFLMICLALPVMAVPPFAQSGSGSIGYDIKAPQAEFVKAGVNLSLHFHVYNKTNGLAIFNDTTECHFHLYGINGGHINKQENLRKIYDTFDWEVELDGKNISTPGQYSYIFQCNDSTSGLGGFISFPFIVTKSGFNDEPADSTSGVAIILFLLSLTGLFLWFSLSSYNLSKDDILNFILKKCFLIIGVYLTILNTAILSTIADKANLGVTSEILTYSWIFGWGGYILILYLLFSTIIRVIGLWNLKKKDKRTGVR